MFYDLWFDWEHPTAWVLSHEVDENKNFFPSGHFAIGRKFELLPYVAYRSYKGAPVDFTLAVGGAPVVSKAFADVVQEFAPQAFQRIPVSISDAPMEYEILNVLLLVDNCIDFERSDAVNYFNAETRPDRAGEILTVTGLKLKADCAQGQHIFRLSEWTLPVIVSEALKDALEKAQFTGMRFIAV